MVIVLTGKMYNLAGEHVIRAERHRLITRLGHRPWNTVTAGMDVLVVGGNSERYTAKRRTAERMGIAIISSRQFFEWLQREDESLEAYVAQYAGVTEEQRSAACAAIFTGGLPQGQVYQIGGRRVSEQEFRAARAQAGRAFDAVQEQADMEEGMRQYVTTQDALADPRREEVMADVREQMKDNPAHKPYSRGRKIRIRNHRKADYT